MATVVHDLELPTIDLLAAEDLESRQALVDEHARAVVAGPVRARLRGHSATRTSSRILRERRFHQAAAD